MKTIIRLSLSRIRDIDTNIVLPVYFALKPSTYCTCHSICALFKSDQCAYRVISKLVVISSVLPTQQSTYNISVHLPPYHVIRHFFQVISGTYRVISRPTLILLSVQFCDIGTLNALSLHESYYQFLAAIQKTRVWIPISKAKIFY